MAIEPQGDDEIKADVVDAKDDQVVKFRKPINFAVTAGSANVQTLSLGSEISAYVNGQPFCFIAGYTNTDTMTLNVDAVGAKAVKRPDGNDVLPGDVKLDGAFYAMYESGNDVIILLNPDHGIKTWTPTYGANGLMTFGSVTTNFARYQRFGDFIYFEINATGTVGGSVNTTLTFTLPVTPASLNSVFATQAITSASAAIAGRGRVTSLTGSGTCSVDKYDSSAWAAGSTKGFSVSGFYKAA